MNTGGIDLKKEIWLLNSSQWNNDNGFFKIENNSNKNS